MKTLKLLFNENDLGLLALTMLIILTVYVCTESHMVQMFGLGLGFVVLIYLIGFVLVSIADGVVHLIKYLKRRKAND